MINRNKKGIIYGTLAAISYGTNPLFALYLYTGGIGVNSVLFYRYAIAVLLYGFWLKLINKKKKKNSQRINSSFIYFRAFIFRFIRFQVYYNG